MRCDPLIPRVEMLTLLVYVLESACVSKRVAKSSGSSGETVVLTARTRRG